MKQKLGNATFIVLVVLTVVIGSSSHPQGMAWKIMRGIILA